MARRFADASVGRHSRGDWRCVLAQQQSDKAREARSCSTYQHELFSFVLQTYLDTDADQISLADLNKLSLHIDEWLAQRTGEYLIPVPCFLSPAPSPQFSVGPVTFLYLEDITRNAYYREASADALSRHEFGDLIEQMRSERAHWLGFVEIEGCDRERSQDFADLAVDLAIIALQLAQPYLDTNTMSRLSNRRGAHMEITLARTGGRYAGGRSYRPPGVSIGHGYLGKIVTDAKPIIDAVGARVRSFATGAFRLPVIEQAWCDAAYWLREGLAERIDSIAVAKLETSLEVFLIAESSRGSEARLLEMMDVFFGLAPDQQARTHSDLTVTQFAKGFVRDRSRVLHGTWSTLNSRLAGSRDALEYLAVTVLRAAVMEIDAYLAAGEARDDVPFFLNWVKQQRQVRAAKPP
jgi:hypothetical protein